MPWLAISRFQSRSTTMAGKGVVVSNYHFQSLPDRFHRPGIELATTKNGGKPSCLQEGILVAQWNIQRACRLEYHLSAGPAPA